jgi:hypothetical protein
VSASAGAGARQSAHTTTATNNRAHTLRMD